TIGAAAVRVAGLVAPCDCDACPDEPRDTEAAGDAGSAALFSMSLETSAEIATSGIAFHSSGETPSGTTLTRIDSTRADRRPACTSERIAWNTSARPN